MPIVQNKKPAKRQLTAEDILVAGLDALGEGFALFDSSQAFVCCNRPFVVLAGYPIGLCQPGEPLASFLRFDAEKNERPGAADALAAERQAEIDSRDEGTVERRGADGRQLIARHRRMADGSLLLTFSDVTDVRRAEAALRASERRSRAARHHDAGDRRLRGAAPQARRHAAAPCRRHHHLGLGRTREHRQGGRARRRGLHPQAVQSHPAQGAHRRIADPQAVA